MLLGPVYVPDSSVLIGITDEYDEPSQENIFACLESYVSMGLISYPAVVRREVGNVKYIDAAARWVMRTFTSVKHQKYPSDRLIAAAMQCGRRSVGTTAEADPDSIILAHALALKEAGHHAIVITLDIKGSRDEPPLDASCRACGIETITDIYQFLEILECLPGE